MDALPLRRARQVRAWGDQGAVSAGRVHLPGRSSGPVRLVARNSVAYERRPSERRPVDVQGRLVTDETGERDHDDRDHGPPSGAPGHGVRDDADRPADVRTTRSDPEAGLDA